MSLVLDASVTMAWCFEDEGSPATEELLDQVVEDSAVEPAIWRFEVGNALQTAIRRKRIDRGFRDAALVKLSALPITIDPETDAHVWSTALRLSEALRFPSTTLPTLSWRIDAGYRWRRSTNNCGLPPIHSTLSCSGNLLHPNF